MLYIKAYCMSNRSCKNCGLCYETAKSPLCLIGALDKTQMFLSISLLLSDVVVES